MQQGNPGQSPIDKAQNQIVSEILDYNFGNISQEIPTTVSHSADGADYNTLPFTNRTSTFQSSTFPQSTNQESHSDVNITSGTNVRYAIQNESFHYFNSSQGLTFPSAQTFENSDCNSGAENPAMAFITETDTSQLNPVEPPFTYNSAWQQQDPNLSFYNQLPPNCPGSSHDLALYESTNKNYNISMNMESQQSGIPNFKVPRFQEYDAVAIARKSDRTEENTNFASYLNCTSINAKYHQRSNTTMRLFYIMHLRELIRQFLFDRQIGMNEIPHCSYKSQDQFDDKLTFQNIFQCHYCGKFSSYQRNFSGLELPVKSSDVPFSKCNECIETMKLKEKILPCPKLTEVFDESPALKLQKI
ncbi:hypothetical protein CEXT_206871 [Caerostris extrusa]|uniref:Uncharacterized protein n=1 Tax=Caerostris extrusa TaxID=172846 RepID=A0AAV4VFK3_CAEEX|nr:hypothetical protein CEXT_206871 [Caerostris extrusa]